MMLHVVVPKLYKKYYHVDVLDIVFLFWFVTAIGSLILSIFAMFGIKKRKFRIAYVLLNIFLAVFFSFNLLLTFTLN